MTGPKNVRSFMAASPKGPEEAVQGIELEAVGLQFEPYRWRPCGVTWDSSRTVVVTKLRRTSAQVMDVLSKLAMA